MAMTYYYGDASSGSNTLSWNDTSNYGSYTTYSNKKISVGDLMRKKDKAKNKERYEYKSPLLKWARENIKFDSGRSHLIVLSPMFTERNNNILRDFRYLRRRVGYNIFERYMDSGVFNDIFKRYSAYDGIDDVFQTIFIDGVLEHLPGIMARALFIKAATNKLRYGTFSCIILRTRSRRTIKEMAKKYNYPKDGNGYLITLSNGSQSYLEGINSDELQATLKYGRINNIYNNNTKLFPLGDDCTIIDNGYR